MIELGLEDVEAISGAGTLSTIGMGMIAFAGAAAVMGDAPLGAVLGLGGVLCIVLD